ncbi:Mov34/MPN/PAD-1 family protein [Gracilibacillus sp. D59]|uniref:Mov34/MPN/PAD-1 family protein n=1 Tax=Gracilibacillus sp. D59 TaxID=3457434 RepID=UPI003FCD3EF4
MEKIISFPDELYQKLIAEGEKKLPYEACGLLAGTHNQVKSFWPLQNQLASTTRFFVPKKVVSEALKCIENRKEQVLAVFHTHPSTKPVPSQYDLSHHPDEDVDMVIVSFKYPTPEIKWYQIKSKRWKECTIHISEAFQ